jgi:hypothetical protein
MGKAPETTEDAAMGRHANNAHLDELLDAALAGTFPASDPTASFVFERERPVSGEAPPERGTARGEGEQQADEQDVGE